MLYLLYLNSIVFNTLAIIIMVENENKNHNFIQKDINKTVGQSK